MKKTFAEYLAMGMVERTARYFSDGRRRIVSAILSHEYTILLVFDNCERRLLDRSSKFSKESVFTKLAEPAVFRRIFVDEGGNLAWDLDSTVDSREVWNNRVDFCHDACYLNSTPA